VKKLLLLIASILAVSCNEKNEIVDPTLTHISLSLQNLPPITGAHYQLWATFFNFNKKTEHDSPTHEGEFVSLGEFRILTDGSLRNLYGGEARFGLPAGSNPQLLKDIVIAVQAEHEHANAQTSHDEPGSILIGGAFHGDERLAIADMTISYADAFKTSFGSVTGKCTIVCPTSPADSNNGIWFVEGGPPLTAGLHNLPSLPGEWRYEGWVVSGSQYYSTGRFARADSADYDGAGPQRGSGVPYNFPGQDFVQGATRPVLIATGFKFMVTIEPEPDTSPEPFFLMLLSGQSGSRVVTLQNVITHSSPSARVIVER
jgi:hypothetical protein